MNEAARVREHAEPVSAEGGERTRLERALHPQGRLVRALVQVRQARDGAKRDDGAGGKGASNAVDKEIYDSVPVEQQSDSHSWCGEPDALSGIANEHKVSNMEELRKIVNGGKSATVRNDGKELPFCSSCGHMVARLGVCDEAKK